MDKENLLKYYSSIKEKIHQIEEFNSKFIDYKNILIKKNLKQQKKLLII